MTSPPAKSAAPPDPLLRRVNQRRVLARSVLWFERLWPAVWPALGLAGLFICAALLDVVNWLPPGLHLLLLIIVGFGVLALLWRGLRDVMVPSAGAVDRRLEFASGLRHQPLATIGDRPALAGMGGDALWQAHVARTRGAVARLRTGLPHPGLAARDPRALRAGLVVGLIACIVVAGPDAGSRLARAFAPHLPPVPAPPATQIQAWITPPGYTRLAPIFLRPEGGSVSVPAGSHLTVSLTGGEGGEPGLSMEGWTGSFKALDAGSWQADRDLASGGRLVIRRRGHQLAAWDISTVADAPPTIAFDGAPGQSARGLQVRIPWKAQDDYGVAEVQAEFRLKDRPDAPPLTIGLPLPGGNLKSTHGVALHDLTAHPWAGLPVKLRLLAKDGAGQKGSSDEVEFTLPERQFTHPVARAVIAVRKGLSLHPEDRAKALDALGTISRAPDAFNNDFGVFLNLRAIIALLAHNPQPSSVDEAQQRMWQLALHLEEGQTERTARQLEAARKAVREALDKAARTGHLDQKDFDKKLAQLEKAIQEHLKALMEQARREGLDMPFDPNAQTLTQKDLERMMQQMREAAQQGRMQDAEQQLAQLEQMLKDLQNARPMRPQDRQNAQKQQRGRQQMGAVQDLVRRESGLLDNAQGRRDENQPRQRSGLMPDGMPPSAPSPQGQQGQSQQGQSQAGQGKPGGPRDTDARTQNALRRALGELMQQFGDLTGKIPQPLSDADTAMRDSVQALKQGQDSAAATAQQKAIEALSKGGREMSQQMARQFGLQPGEDQGDNQGGQDQTDGTGDQNANTARDDGNGHGTSRADRQGGRRDPLGRLTGHGTAGADEGNDVHVPEKMEQARSREIENELRRREGERTRPQQELDYINRLLKMY